MLNLYVKNLTIQNISCITEGTDNLLSLQYCIKEKSRFFCHKNSYLQNLNQKFEFNRIHETQINVKLFTNYEKHPIYMTNIDRKTQL